MPTREEIREGLHAAIQGDAETPVGEPCEYCRSTERALTYLRSQGVVIKVDRKLPRHLTYYTNGDYEDLTSEVLNEAGYVAVESLIKEEVKLPPQQTDRNEARGW